MKIEDAVEKVESIRDRTLRNNPSNKPEIEALNMAVEALVKQSVLKESIDYVYKNDSGYVPNMSHAGWASQFLIDAAK